MQAVEVQREKREEQDKIINEKDAEIIKLMKTLAEAEEMLAQIASSRQWIVRLTDRHGQECL